MRNLKKIKNLSPPGVPALAPGQGVLQLVISPPLCRETQASDYENYRKI